MFGGTWPGDVMAIAVIISGLGALNGWTMICAEMPWAAAKTASSAAVQTTLVQGVPAYGIVVSTVLASIAMAVNYLGASGETVFTTLVLMSGITAAIPYAFSALAQAKWRWIDHKTVQTPRFVRDMTIAIVSLVFAVLFIFYSRNSGHSFWVYWAPFFLAGAAPCCSAYPSIWPNVARYEHARAGPCLPVKRSRERLLLVDNASRL